MAIWSDARIRGMLPLMKSRHLKELRFLADARVSDDGLRLISEVPSIESVFVEHPRGAITDAGVAALAPLKNLRRLVLLRTKVQGTGFSALTSQRRLVDLELEGSPINDRGLATIGALPALEELALSCALISDSGLRALSRGAKRLRSLMLDLRRSKVTSKGFAALRTMPLRELMLRNAAALTDSGLKAIGAMSRLEVLCIDGSSDITPAGLRALQVRRLRRLEISSCPGISGEALQEFRTAHRRCAARIIFP